MFEYNTSKSNVILKEYGRNVQKLAEHIMTIEDRDKRTQYAATLVELMRQLNPSVRENNETTQKLWDDLFIMTNFELNVDAPYPMPEVDILTKKPKRLSYNTDPVTYKHYGKNIEKLIDKAIATESEEERKGAIIYLGKLMKGFYQTWNKEGVDDAVIIKNIKEISGGKLDISVDEVKSNNLFESQKGGRSKGRRGSGGSNRRKK
ncbi:hypothetical protein OKW21_006313 [Catalinimonas alkaloidigena]|uniref:DUF4290 domain-containing protein n=1 Tax=Catalinimonas alkaloidigena TaxID=1075417 RepID=UPI00240685A4|nr:DUF4290 domain-containing protein [Catalinimonas alkaloidigena]MDF9801050.1 hypothetical protein [Catalinimonas alkaloidigena]